MKAGEEPRSPSPRRARARRGEGERLREQILEAASQLLVERGSANAVSIRAVADAVGVTPPSIYLHFADKNELIFAICDRYFDELARVSREAAAETDDQVERIIQRGRAYIRFGLDNPEPYRVLFMRKPDETPLPFQYEKIISSTAFGHLLEDVTTAIEGGRVEGDPLVVSIYLWSVVHGITSLLISKPDFPWPEIDGLIDSVARNALNGVTAR